MALASKLGVDAKSLIEKVESLRRSESDAWTSRLPTGNRLSEITEMQARAIFEAAAQVTSKGVKAYSGNHDSAGQYGERIEPSG